MADDTRVAGPFPPGQAESELAQLAQGLEDLGWSVADRSPRVVELRRRHRNQGMRWAMTGSGAVVGLSTGLVLGNATWMVLMAAAGAAVGLLGSLGTHQDRTRLWIDAQGSLHRQDS